MQTPNNDAGLILEIIMARVKAKIPEIKTWEYNRTYSAVYEGLTEYFAPVPTLAQLGFSQEDVIYLPGGGGGFINRKKR
jgi:hypothetical protein